MGLVGAIWIQRGLYERFIKTMAAVHSDMMGVVLRSSEHELHMPLWNSSPEESDKVSEPLRLRQLQPKRNTSY